MLSLTGHVVGQRMLVPLRVYTHARAVAARQLPRRVADVHVLVDTGATGSMIEASVLRSLGDDPSGSIEIRTSLGKKEDRLRYFVQASMPMLDLAGREVHSPLHPISAAAATDGTYPPPQRGVLGIDFLQHFALVYDGPGKTFTLTCEAG